MREHEALREMIPEQQVGLEQLARSRTAEAWYSGRRCS
jgi:hypothetical protein